MARAEGPETRTPPDPPGGREPLRRWTVLAGALAVLDQATKLLALETLIEHRPVPVLSFLNFTLTHNPGAAFSLLSDAGGWQRWLFVALTLGVGVLIIAWLRSLPRGSGWSACGLALILGGALGNLCDRLARGAVVDFVDLHYAGWHWPAFNVADSGITVGAAMLLLALLREGRGQTAKADGG